MRYLVAAVALASMACGESAASGPPWGAITGAASTSGGAAGSGGAGGGQVITNDGSIADGPAAYSLCPASGSIGGTPPEPKGLRFESHGIGIKYVTATDSAVYWATDTVIYSGEMNSERVLVDHTATPNHFQALAVEGDTLYFSEVGNSNSLAVAKMPIDGSSAPVKIADANSPSQIAVASGYVYYYDSGLSEIARVPTGGGTPTVLVRGVNPAGLAVAGGYVYFVHPRAMSFASHLLRVPVDAQAPAPDAGVDAGDRLVPAGSEIVVATDRSHPNGPVTDGISLYYDDKDQLMKLPLAGGTPSVIAQASGEVGAIAPFGGEVYWSTEVCGDVLRSSSDGGAPTLVVRNAAADHIAVNATRVYFLGFPGQLLSAPR